MAKETIYFIESLDNLRIRRVKKDTKPGTPYQGSKDECLIAQYALQRWRLAMSRWMTRHKHLLHAFERAAPAFKEYARGLLRTHHERQPEAHKYVQAHREMRLDRFEREVRSRDGF